MMERIPRRWRHFIWMICGRARLHAWASTLREFRHLPQPPASHRFSRRVPTMF